MKIGLRTIKTVITATVGIMLASYLGLQFPATAGIIAILSVTNSKKSSFRVGIGRIIALLVAFVIAYGCYSLLGYTPLAFGMYLLIYIPLAARCKMSEAIPVNSVLITHFLNAKSMDLGLVLNALSLLLIGVGLALLANLYMPNVEEDIKKHKDLMDEHIRFLLKNMSELLNGSATPKECHVLIEGAAKSIKQGEQYAKNHRENQLRTQDDYELLYFQMRRMQLTVLENMVRLMTSIQVESDVAEGVSNLVGRIYDLYSEDNDGRLLSQHVQEVYEEYEGRELPKTREEFENRARLYQLLTEIQTFIDIKVAFADTNKD